jgi:metal-responsive CopG/Arc/MetJ family transcriptional regulator
MPTEQLLLRLPEDLVRRFRRAVPSRERSQFIQRLLEQALTTGDSDDDPLYQAALEVERDTTLAAEMADWETTTLRDGLNEADGPAHRA